MDIVDRLHEVKHIACFGEWDDFKVKVVKATGEAAEEISRLRGTIPTEDALDDATSEGYEQGYAEGQNDCQGAYADLWSMLLSHLKKHDCEPASDDGYSHNAGQMMDAVFEREGNLRREIENLRKERDGESKRYADLANGFWQIVDSAAIKEGLPSCELNALSRIVDRLSKAERERAEARAALAHAESVFLRYAEMHDAKGTPDGRTKADANLQEAYRCRRARTAMETSNGK